MVLVLDDVCVKMLSFLIQIYDKSMDEKLSSEMFIKVPKFLPKWPDIFTLLSPKCLLSTSYLSIPPVEVFIYSSA